MPARNPQSSSTEPSSARIKPLDPLDHLRQLRVRPDRARDLHDDMGAQLKSLQKISRTESALIAAWNAAAPDGLAKRCTPKGVKAGHFEIIVPDASARYQLDRWLRGGGQRELSALAKVPIRGVRVLLKPGN